jgi:SAM-dependent methyltransferase
LFHSSFGRVAKPFAANLAAVDPLRRKRCLNSQAKQLVKSASAVLMQQDEGVHMSGSEMTKQQPTVLDFQRGHWERTFASRPSMFGDEPSYPAQVGATLFKAENKLRILEIGGGQGRDSLFYAHSGFNVTVLDYSEAGLREIQAKAEAIGVADRIRTLVHDVRTPLPLEAASFDAVYSHMLYCMALTSAELVALSAEICRVLVPGGLNVFTVRTTQDAHYGTGIHRGEDMYEVGGFIVHFFDRAKVEEVSRGFEIVSIQDFEEGGLPRRLFLVAVRRPK